MSGPQHAAGEFPTYDQAVPYVWRRRKEREGTDMELGEGEEDASYEGYWDAGWWERVSTVEVMQGMRTRTGEAPEPKGKGKARATASEEENGIEGGDLAVKRGIGRLAVGSG
jgi:hypothetical protein